jgi:polysaccharide biosynthesis protein PslJ
MRRYTLPGGLPFELDPYRVLVAFVLFGWTASLLADPTVRLRRSGLEAPLILILASSVASIVANPDRAASAGAEVAKGLTFLLSYFVVFFLIVSVTNRQRQVDFLLKVVVGGGAILAGCAILESRTHYNLFDHLSAVIPVLQFQPESTDSVIDMRGFRAFGSAQHPIALSAALVLLLPISIYLVQRDGRRRWWMASGLLLTGALATMSRTSIIMLLVAGLTFVWLRPRQMKRLWPAVFPALALVHFALPGTLGTIKQSFFPAGGLLAQQAANPGYSGQGRVADLGPALAQWAQHPLFGSGYETRGMGLPGIDGQILDDQWLGTLLETGLLGFVAWLWLLVWCVRRFARAARADRSTHGWLMTALTASVASFAVGMIFFDAFAFIQVTLLLFVLIALGCAAGREDLGFRSNANVPRIRLRRG